MKTHATGIDILLVEDNPGDVRLTQEAFKNSRLTNKLYVVNNGMDALKFLHKQDTFQNAPTPDLILLDLNMPKKDGREVLAEIKEDDTLRTIPIIVLTTSDADADVLKMYQLQANCYITKPVDFDKFIKIVKQIEEFWVTIVRLPPKGY